jgi:hypothetical protein
MENKTDVIIQNFADFLSFSWESFDKSCNFNENIWDKKDILEDWLESNWELMVVQALCSEKRTVTEYTATRYRFISIPNSTNMKLEYEPFCQSKSTDKLYCLISTKEIQNIKNLDFIKFVNWNNKGYEERAPFNSVLLENDLGSKFVVSRDKVVFCLREYKG